MELYDVLSEVGFCCVSGMEAVAEHSWIRQFSAGKSDVEDAKELKGFAKQIEKAIAKEAISKELLLPGSHTYKPYNGVCIPIKAYGIKCLWWLLGNVPENAQ